MAKRGEVPLSQSALLVIDVQDSFKIGPRWARRNNPSFEANVATLIGAFRSAGLPVFFVLHTDPDPGFATDSPAFRLMDFIHVETGEPVLIKDTRNAFSSTDLRALLDRRGVKRLAITGIQTEQCCETTARIAADLGYDVDFVLDATLTFPILDEESGEELSTAEIERRTAFVLRHRFARICTTERLAGDVAALPAVNRACAG